MARYLLDRVAPSLTLSRDDPSYRIDESQLENGHLLQTFTVFQEVVLCNHCHDGWEWVLFTAGSGVAYLEEKGEVVVKEVGPNSYIYIKRQQGHAFRLAPGTIMVVCKQKPLAEAQKWGLAPAE